MTRIVTISGFTCTGSTTIGKALAKRLEWEYVSAGQRFRDWASTHKCDLIDIPMQVHSIFDDELVNFLKTTQHVVVDGRYTAWFCRHSDDVLRVRTVCDTDTRGRRLRTRDMLQLDHEGSLRLIADRDAADYAVFHDRYGSDDFLADALFDVTVANGDRTQLDAIIADIMRAFAKN